MSLDGVIPGPNVRVGNGLGDDGERLHNWMFDAKTDADTKIVDERYATYESRGAGRDANRHHPDILGDGIQLFEGRELRKTSSIDTPGAPT